MSSATAPGGCHQTASCEVSQTNLLSPNVTACWGPADSWPHQDKKAFSPPTCPGLPIWWEQDSVWSPLLAACSRHRAWRHQAKQEKRFLTLLLSCFCPWGGYWGRGCKIYTQGSGKGKLNLGSENKIKLSIHFSSFRFTYFILYFMCMNGTGVTDNCEPPFQQSNLRPLQEQSP